VEEMKTRLVVVTAQTVLDILKDYLGIDNIPADARLVSLMYSKNERGKVAMVVESGGLRQDEKAINVTFDIKRVYTVGTENNTI
jgi:hypothetical protein